MARPKKFSRRPAGYLNVTESAAYLGINRGTFYAYRKESDFPKSITHGGEVLYSREELRKWAADCGRTVDE